MALQTGSHLWKVEADLLTKIKNANNKQKFVSPIFKMCELNWQLLAYPNGQHNESSGSFILFLKLLAIPGQWKHIVVDRRLECLETKSSTTSTSLTMTKEDTTGWAARTMLFEEIQSLQALSIKVDITIQKIVLNDNDKILYENKIVAPTQSKYTWVIDQEFFNIIKKSHAGKTIISDIYDTRILTYSNSSMV